MIAKYETVILNGDIYDYWVAPHEQLIRLPESKRLWELLRERSYFFIRGNHDWEFPSDSYEEIRIHVGGNYVASVIHGHQFDYRHRNVTPPLGSIIFSKIDIYLSRLLGFPFQAWLQRFHNLPLVSGRVQKVLDSIRNESIRYLRSSSRIDWVIYGHSHFPTLYRFPDGRGYVDGGSFVTGASCVVLEDNGPRLVDLSR